MTNPQYYFLLLACGSFLLLGVTLASATAQYRTWKRRTEATAPVRKR